MKESKKKCDSFPPSPSPLKWKTIKQQWKKTKDSCCYLVHHTERMLYQKVSKENKLISSSTLICNLFSNNLDLNPIEILQIKFWFTQWGLYNHQKSLRRSIYVNFVSTQRYEFNYNHSNRVFTLNIKWKMSPLSKDIKLGIQ